MISLFTCPDWDNIKTAVPDVVQLYLLSVRKTSIQQTETLIAMKTKKSVFSFSVFIQQIQFFLNQVFGRCWVSNLLQMNIFV